LQDTVVGMYLLSLQFTWGPIFYCVCVCVCVWVGGWVGGVNTCSQAGWCKVHHNYHYMFVIFLAVGGLAATFW